MELIAVLLHPCYFNELHFFLIPILYIAFVLKLFIFVIDLCIYITGITKHPSVEGPVDCVECLRKVAHANMEQCLRED